jgi:hypothetical protein
MQEQNESLQRKRGGVKLDHQNNFAQENLCILTFLDLLKN